MIFDFQKSILEEVKHEFLTERNIQLWVKRDDLIDEEVSGNKWRKLKFNMQQFQALKNTSILTFGGAFSNHLLATASACKRMGIPSIGVVRGEELNASSNSVLRRCDELGMHLHFVSREEYTLRAMNAYYEELLQQFPNAYIIPEGGANYYGMIGCQQIVTELNDFEHLFVAQGTATTSAGLLLGLSEAKKLHVVPVLKGFDSIREMESLYRKATIDEETIHDLMENIVVHEESHFGGYAKTTSELLDFMRFSKEKLKLPLDRVYTAKAFHALWNWMSVHDIRNTKIVFLHTGGLGEHSKE